MIFWKILEDNTQSNADYGDIACEISEGSLEVSKDTIVSHSIFELRVCGSHQQDQKIN